LSDCCQFTRWFPLVGGLGWGRIRLSLLFKPIDIQLPPRISGYEVATLVISQISATNIARHSERSFSVVLETESDKFEITAAATEDDITYRLSTDGLATPGSIRTFNFDNDNTKELEWEVSKPIRLAVEYRHSCSVVISFVMRSGIVKKKKVFGIATMRLDDCEDGQGCVRSVPVFATSEVKDAVKAARAYHDEFHKPREYANDLSPSPSPSPSPARKSFSRSRSSSTSNLRQDVKLIGFVTLGLAVVPGISRTHKKLGKKDARFRKVYEAWEISGDVEGEESRSVSNHLTSDIGMDEGEGDEGGSSSDEDGVIVPAGVERDHQVTLSDDGEEKQGYLAERRAHAEALHKRVSGIASRI
jgi:hypothetical protein